MNKFKCLVCGMIINPSSFNLNSSSFIEKNSKENIVNCPFCGVGKTYLSNKKEIFNIDNETLDKESLKVLDHAMKLEVFNGEFYEEAIKLAKDTQIKQIFEELRNIELMHARIHKRLGGFEKLPKLRRIDYTRHNTDKLLLEEAYKREDHAILFYKKNAAKVNNYIVKKVFKALSDVEKQHKIITKKY